MLTLSAARDRIVRWFDLLLLHKTVKKLSRICLTIFSSFYRISHSTYMLVFVVAELYIAIDGSLWLILTLLPALESC